MDCVERSRNKKEQIRDSLETLQKQMPSCDIYQSTIYSSTSVSSSWWAVASEETSSKTDHELTHCFTPIVVVASPIMEEFILLDRKLCNDLNDTIQRNNPAMGNDLYGECDLETRYNLLNVQITFEMNIFSLNG